MNRRGESYVQICVVVIILTMILSVMITFVSAVSVVSLARRNAKTVLDSFIMINSIEIYDSIKNGHSYTDSLDSAEYTADLCRFSSLEADGEYLKAENGSYWITQPEVGFTTDNRLKLYVSFTVYVPLEFDGTVVQTVAVPLTVEANLDEKF